MRPWDEFFNTKVRAIFAGGKNILDIGGGLRACPDRGNRCDPERAWITEYFPRVNYRILDPVPDYKPDIVGDIHALPLPDASEDAVICLAVLEHVEDPFRAVSEMQRVLKPDGKLLLYVPFLFAYHAQTGYYHDYWRFSADGIGLLLKNFHAVEICPVHGAIATWFNLLPGLKGLLGFGDWLDQIFGKYGSKQTSGYYVFATK